MFWQQFGTFGDMFGCLNVLFSGLELVGVAYAVILQDRQLRHQQAEIEKSDQDRKEAQTEQQKTLFLTALTLLAQTYTQRYMNDKSILRSHAW